MKEGTDFTEKGTETHIESKNANIPQKKKTANDDQVNPEAGLCYWQCLYTCHDCYISVCFLLFFMCVRYTV